MTTKAAPTKKDPTELTSADRFRLARRILAIVGDLDPEDAKGLLASLSSNWAVENELRQASNVLRGLLPRDREAVLSAVTSLITSDAPAEDAP